MDDEGQHQDQVQQLQEQMGGQQWHQQQQRQQCGPGFGSLYTTVCDRIRAENILDTVMEHFQQCHSDQARISYVWQLPEVRELQLKSHTSGKCSEEAQSCEELYDMLVNSENNAARALEVVQRAILKTPADDTNVLARRFMKRAWALLLLEQFDDAFTDASRALHIAKSPGLLWNAHEILAHCHAKMKSYKKAEPHFVKALEGLRKSSASNEEKAAVAGRVSTVFRMVKEENKPKNRAKETNKKQQEMKTKKFNKKKKKEQTKSENSIDEDVIREEENDEEEEAGMEKSRHKLPEVPKISLGKNSKLDCASAAVSVVVIEGRGRCVIANRDIRAGSVVMVDKPYASVVNADQLHQRCNNCCRRCLTSLPCLHCAVVVFCSDECRSSGAAQHRLECSVMTHLYDATLGKMAPLVFRILTAVSWQRLKKSKEKLLSDPLLEDEAPKLIESIMEGNEQQKWRWEGHYSPTDYLTTLYLVTNASKRSFGDHFKRALSAVYISQCLAAAGFFGSNPGADDIKFAATLAVRHLQSCSCNAYEISEMQLKENIAENKSLEIGGAVYPTVSLSNHSCFPNVARYNVGTCCVLRATRLIPRGAEVLDNYGYYFHVIPQVERRDTLRLQYKFECSCEACTGSWPLYPHRQGEPIIFRCPVTECNAHSSFLDGRQMECKSCGDKQLYGKLVKSISTRLDNYSKALSLMHDAKFESALKVLLQHQEFLETQAVYPAKHYTDVQEMLRQCLNCLGNTHCVNPKVNTN
uniref:SET and MYND domain-containing protein DDB_G0284059-like n=1 Tax=Hirondellea gigas TaxID=1518452 RepID=A0A2P2I4E0_9CRUS